VEYSKYRRIRIEICSPGGSVSALEHYLAKLQEWRKLGVVFETVSLISTASCAAIILSLGDVGHRRAYSSAKLLYHNVYIPQLQAATKERCQQTEKDLRKTDDKLIGALVCHIYDNPKTRASIKLKSFHEALQKYEPKLSLSELNDSDLSDEEPTREKYETVLRELFLNDRAINPEEAVLLGLIDEVL
jgi:ATP-dependent protease ClpP protease subunit